MALWPWVVIPLPTRAQSRFLLGTVSPGRYTVSPTAHIQGSTMGVSAQEHLAMHHSELCLAHFLLLTLKSSFPEHIPIAPGTQGLLKVTLYTAFLTPGSEKKMLYNGRTAMCGEGLPVSTAGQGSQLKVVHKQTRAAGDAESPGTGAVEMWLTGHKCCKHSTGRTQKIPVWELMAPPSPDPTWSNKALRRGHDVHPGCRLQHDSSVLERN